MTDPLALALRDLRGSPNTEAAGHADAEDAQALRAALRRLGWALVPLELDDAMRTAIWRARAAELVHTPRNADAYAAHHLANDAQRALDRATWTAMHQHAAERLGDG